MSAITKEVIEVVGAVCNEKDIQITKRQYTTRKTENRFLLLIDNIIDFLKSLKVIDIT
ncbi:MAG: hypothetical protein ACTSWY_12210 [Promethearchaeota archaeon]